MQTAAATKAPTRAKVLMRVIKYGEEIDLIIDPPFIPAKETVLACGPVNHRTGKQDEYQISEIVQRIARGKADVECHVI